MSSLDRIKKKRQQLSVENNKNLSSADKSMERISLLRDELNTTGKIDYGDIAPSVLDNFSSPKTDIAPVGSKNDLTTRRNELMEQIKNYDRKKNEDYWWDDDKGFLPNVGNVLSKLFVDSDSDNRYVKDEKYDALVKEYDAVNKAVEENYVATKKYDDGIVGAAEKFGDVFTGAAKRSLDGATTTIQKILGVTPTETDQDLMEKLGEKAKIETDSKLGKFGLDMADALGGQVLPAALNPLGSAVSLASSFATFGGSAYNQAIQEGKTEEQAMKYGLAIGSLETLMNKLLPSYEIGGKNVYGKTLSGNFVNNVMSKISSNAFLRKTLSGGFGEFTEESLQQVLEPMLKNAILEEENGADFWNIMKDDFGEGIKQLGSQIFNKDVLYAGLLGATTSAVMGAGSNIDAYRYEKATGRNVDTGLTANEQKVVDSEVAKRTEGKNLTKKQIAKIETEVKNELEKGYISTDTIESVLGGDTYNNLKSTRDNKTKIENEIKELEGKKNAEITVKEMEHLKDLREQLKGIDTNTLETDLQGKMGQIIKSDGYLQRSYQEKAKKGQLYEQTEVSDNEKINSWQQSFIDAKSNNTSKAHDFSEFGNKIIRDKNISMRAVNYDTLVEEGKMRKREVDGNAIYEMKVNGKWKEVAVNGFKEKGVLNINLQSNKAFETTVGHEIGEFIKDSDPVMYEELKNIAIELGKADGTYSESTLNKYADLYGENTDNAVDEYVNDKLGELWANETFVEQLSTKPNLIKKIIGEIKHLVKMATTGSSEQRKLLSLQHKLENKLKEAYQKTDLTKESNTKTNTQYSLTDNQGRTLTKEQQEYFKDSKVRDENGYLLEVYHGTNVDFNVFNYDNFGVNGNRYGTGFYFTDDIKEAEHFTNNGTIKKVYLNIKKPLNAYGKKMSYSKFSKILNSLNEYGKNNIDNYNNEEIFGTNEKAKKFGHQDNISKSIYDFYNNSNSNAELMEAMFIYSNKMGLDIPTSLNIFEKATGNDGMVGEMDNGKKIYVTFNSNQIKNIDNTKPTTDADIRYSLGDDTLPRNPNLTYGEDVKYQEAIAPLKEEIQTLTETVQELKEQIAPVRDEYAPLTEEDLPYLEQQYNEAPKEDIAPPEAEDTTPVIEDEVTTTKSLEDVRDFDEVGSRKVKAYQYENPEVRPYFQEMATYMLGDLENSVKGERSFNDQLYYDTAGEQGFYGTTRQTTDDIAELLDSKYKYTYADIRKGLEAIIEDHGAENIAVAKRIELALDKRLREGYTDVSGYEIPANQDYIKLLQEKEITDNYNNIPIDESLLPPEVEVMKAPMTKATQTTNEITSIENDIEAPVQRKFDLENETITDKNVSDLEKKQQREYKKLGTKEDYISNKAFELYNEVKGLKKGVKASYELGRVLDVGFANINDLTEGMTETQAKEYKNKIWRDITTALLNVKAKPLNTVNKDSTIEAVIRQNLNREYDSKKNDIANMKEEDLVTKTKKELRKALLGTEAQKEFITNALDNAKNRSMALMNNTDTIRNTELVFGRDAGNVINEVIFQKEIDNEADSIAWQNKERQEIKDLGIKARSKESAAVQKYGEKQYVEANGKVVSYTDEDLAREFPNVETQEKIKNAAKVIRSKYDAYIDNSNEVLTKLGFDPIPKRKDYMRHFQELNDVFSRFGIPFNAKNMTEHTLPTDINGLTENWSPQKNYFASMQRRKGLKTNYDAITGIDGYIGGIANLIYHTEDIQRGRAFEELIRETYGEDKGFENLENLPEELQQARMEKIQDNHLSNYAAWVHEWTNNVAGKKNKIDRSIEAMFGRKAFAVLDEVRKQVGSNMIGLNLSSSLTNLIAPVQAASKTNKLAVLKGTADTIKNIFVKDNFMDNNKFLTARMGTDMLSQNAWQKIQNAGYVFMKGMDWFSSNQIVRSKYYELRAKGMSEAQAHSEAGKFAARIMGDRTKGANAQLYNSKLVGLVTQFQLEVNNQLYSQFYDTYHESKEAAQGNALKTAAGMTFTLGQLFALTHLFGQTFEAIAGYNPTFDVVEMLKTAFGWGDDEEEEEKPLSERLKATADQLVDALPYINTLTGGGRIPIASGIPNLVGVATGGKDQYGNELTLEDEMKKLLYLIPPTGGNQFKKTTQGLSMFDEELPVTGSYTDSGNLRFPVEDTLGNRVQAAVFGQWASENARNYFDNERQPLKEKQIQEYADLDMPIKDYWKYREGLKEQSTIEEKFEYINGLDVTDEQKNIMINNATGRENPIDMSGYDNFANYDEFDYATKNPDKYRVIEQIDTFDNYNSYKDDIKSIKEQFSEDNGYSTKDRKAAVQQYINSLSLDIPQKIMLEKMAGGYSIKDYENYMFSYIQSLPMTAEEKQAIHKQLFD